MLGPTQKNWYIQYDFRTFQILQMRNFRSSIFKIAESLEKTVVQEENCIPNQNCEVKNKDKDIDQQIPKWINQIAEAISEIVTLLHNFFKVEEKLTKQQKLKRQFHTINIVLSVENQYTKYFFQRSTQFRINKIISCGLRLNRFCQWILNISNQIKKQADTTTLEDNLKQVYLFMQQRVRETLEITKIEGDHQLNLILIDMLSMILRHNGDSTMKPFLDDTRQKKMMDDVLKTNQMSERFEVKKAIAKEQFQNNRYFQIQADIQMDPNFRKSQSDSDSYIDY